MLVLFKLDSNSFYMLHISVTVDPSSGSIRFLQFAAARSLELDLYVTTEVLQWPNCLTEAGQSVC